MAAKLVEAARLLAEEPGSMQLRYLAAIHDAANEKSGVAVLPLPMEFLRYFSGEPPTR